MVKERVTYNVTIILDNEATKYFEDATDNPSYPYLAIVIANRLLYVVKNSSKIKSGIIDIILIDYNQKEVDQMVDAIMNKR